MGGGSREPGPLGATEPALGTRGPEGLQAGSNAAQALPPKVPEFTNTVDRRAYDWAAGKAQLLLCRISTPNPDFTWTLKKIRQETKNPGQLGFTDASFVSEVASNPKAEQAGYFSGRSALKTIVIRIPKELNVTDAQIAAAEAKKDNAAEVKRLKALRACRDHILAHERAHVDKAWDSLSDFTLGWRKQLGALSDDATVTAKHISDALDEGDRNAPTKIAESATKWDDDDLGPLRSRCRGEHIFVNNGEDATFDYVEPAGGG